MFEENSGFERKKMPKKYFKFKKLKVVKRNIATEVADVLINKRFLRLTKV